MGRVDECRTDEEEHGEGGETSARDPLRDFGTGLRVRTCDEVNINVPIAQYRQIQGTEVVLEGADVHRQIWETAWRFFCDACSRGLDSQWFKGEFFPHMAYGKLDPKTGLVNSVLCSFTVTPPAHNVCRVTVAGPLDNLSVALARSGPGH